MLEEEDIKKLKKKPETWAVVDNGGEQDLPGKIRNGDFVKDEYSSTLNLNIQMRVASQQVKSVSKT